MFEEILNNSQNHTSISENIERKPVFSKNVISESLIHTKIFRKNNNKSKLNFKFLIIFFRY